MDDLIRFLDKKIYGIRREIRVKLGAGGEKALYAAVIAELAAKVSVWISLGRRQPSEVRGPKWAWRLGTFVNGLGPAAYWLVGRK